MLNSKVNFDFSIMKKLWDLAHEKLINIIGRYGILNEYSWMSATLELWKYNHIDGLKLVTGNTKIIAYQCTISWAFKRMII